VQDLDYDEALSSADRATEYRPDSIRAWFVAARVARAPGTIRAVDAAIDRIEHGLGWSARDPALRAEYCALLLERAQRSRLPADADRAERELAKLAADDPENLEVRDQLEQARDLPR
jgi:tetratricopeptide (TPR) repeat protein